MLQDVLMTSILAHIQFSDLYIHGKWKTMKTIRA